jgi:hypothetical protein
VLVSHRHRFIYLKTQKTAGTTVEVFFEPWCLPEGSAPPGHRSPERVTAAGIVGYRGPESAKPPGLRWWNHMSAAQVRAQLGPEVWGSYFKFCVVRNPFEKVVSSFHHDEKRAAQYGRRFRLRRVLAEWRARLAPGSGDPLVDSFRRWLTWAALPIDREIYTLDGALAVDFCIRHERLEADVAEVCARLGLPFEPGQLQQLKSGLRPKDRALADYYDEASLARVREAFAFELAQFGYTAPQGATALRNQQDCAGRSATPG